MYVSLFVVGLLCAVASLVVVLTYRRDMLASVSFQMEVVNNLDWRTTAERGESPSAVEPIRESPSAVEPLLSPAEKVERDLDRCTQIYFQTPKPSHSLSQTALASYFKLLQEFLPRGPSYLLNYRNPCWYSHLHIQNNISTGYFLTRILNVALFKDSTVLRHGLTRIDVGNVSLTRHGDKRLYCLPRFYLAGFPKTGSSSLYEHITEHPDVVKPVVKEGHFWRVFAHDNHGNLAAKRLQILWYLKHFSNAADRIERFPGAITMDASVSTLWDNGGNSLARDEDICLVPSLVSSVYPQSRFIVLMRDPVERLFSDFWYICGKIKMKRDLHHAPALFHKLTLAAVKDFNQCIEEGVSEFECTRLATYSTTNYHHTKDSCYDIRLGIGLYYHHIVKWLNVFPKEQFLFLTSEEMSDDLSFTMRKVWSFMGLKAIRQAKTQAKPRNINWIHTEQYRDKVYMLPETATLLREFYKPFNERLALLLKNKKYNVIWNPK